MLIEVSDEIQAPYPTRIGIADTDRMWDRLDGGCGLGRVTSDPQRSTITAAVTDAQLFYTVFLNIC